MNDIIKLIVASGETSPDIRYGSGFAAPDEFIWFETGRTRGIIVSPLEFARAKAEASPGVEVLPEADFGRNRVEILVELRQRYEASGFVVPERFPLGLAEKMRSAGLIVRPVDGAFFHEREFKSRAEVERIVISQRAGEAGLERALAVLRETDIDASRRLIWRDKPLTSEILRAEIDGAMLKLGMFPTGTICAGGSQSAQPHNQGSGVLKADVPIVMDIFPRSQDSGYWGDLTRTVVRGTPAPVVTRAYDAVLEARELGKSLIRVGADPAAIHNAAAELLAKRGFPTGVNSSGNYGFFHGLGHGVGLDIHETPRLSPRNAKALRGGEVVTVEPGVYYPEWGGIRLEDLVYLDPGSGAVTLTRAPDFLVVE